MTITSDYVTVAPTAQASTNAYAIVARSQINMLRFHNISYTIKNTGANSIDWKVVAGNLPDLSDQVIVNAAATITTGAYGTPYAPSSTSYAYYAIYIIDTVGNSHGEATINGIAKK